jgi:hypothetical protein
VLGLTTRRVLAIVGASALAAIAVPMVVAPSAGAAAGDPVVTLEDGVASCQGVVPTPGSENTTKRLVSGNLEPGGTVTFEIAFPVDASDVGGDFAITDCVFINGEAALKYTVAFVPNNQNFLLTFSLVIPPETPIGAEYCNYAKTTQSPSDSPASNRKAGPACFFVGGDLRIIKVAAGDEKKIPLAGASFDVVCTTNEETIPPVVISGLSGATSFSDGAYRASGVSDSGAIAIAGPEGTPCTVTETDAPDGYDLPADPSFDYTIPAGSAGQEIDYIEDPLTRNETSIVTDAGSGTVGDEIIDTATLSGGTEDPAVTGTITFDLFGPVAGDEPDCSGEPVFSSDVDVSHGNGDYDSEGFTPDAPGNYYWIASYSGDARNLPSSGACGDEGETSVLEPAPTPTPSLSTSPEITTTPPPSLSSSPIALTGAGPVDEQLDWAVALLLLGGAVILAGKRRGYRRSH